nr:hypothetical protein [Tanacetum cinerariifolium]
MTGNISHLSDYEPFNRGYVSFGQGGCKITGKGTIKSGKLEFENVYFVKDLKDFKLIDDTNVLLRTPRQHNTYSIDLNNIVPYKDLTFSVAKASADECMLWHRRLDILEVTTNLEESNGVEADVSNMETTITASPTPTLRIHKDHPKSQMIGPVDTPIQTRNKYKGCSKTRGEERCIFSKIHCSSQMDSLSTLGVFFKSAARNLQF